MALAPLPTYTGTQAEPLSGRLVVEMRCAIGRLLHWLFGVPGWLWSIPAGSQTLRRCFSFNETGMARSRSSATALLMPLARNPGNHRRADEKLGISV